MTAMTERGEGKRSAVSSGVAQSSFEGLANHLGNRDVSAACLAIDRSGEIVR